MRSIIISLLVVLAQCLWVSGEVSAADTSSPFSTSSGMATIATDLAIHELPLTPGRAAQVSLSPTPTSIATSRPLPGLWHEPITAGASICSLLGANWCLALQNDPPTPAVLGVSHSVDGEESTVAPQTQIQALPDTIPKTPPSRILTTNKNQSPPDPRP